MRKNIQYIYIYKIRQINEYTCYYGISLSLVTIMYSHKISSNDGILSDIRMKFLL